MLLLSALYNESFLQTPNLSSSCSDKALSFLSPGAKTNPLLSTCLEEDEKPEESLDVDVE